MTKLTCASHVVMRFYWSEGHINNQYLNDLTELVDDGYGGQEESTIATSDDFKHEIFDWFKDKPWECGVAIQGSTPGFPDTYVEVDVDWDYHDQFERIEQEIIQFLIDDPDVELAKYRFLVKNQEAIRRNAYNPAYTALNQAINKMMGCG